MQLASVSKLLTCSEGTYFGEREVLDRVQSATASIDYCIWP